MNFKYMILADFEVVFESDDFQEVQQLFTQYLNAPDDQKIFMYELNIVINWRWALFTEQGVLTEGRFQL